MGTADAERARAEVLAIINSQLTNSQRDTELAIVVGAVGMAISERG